MKQLLITVFLLAGLVPALQAQTGTGQERRYQTPGQRAEHRTQRMIQLLSLTPEQGKVIHSIHLKEAEEMQGPLDDIRAKRKSLLLIHAKYEQEYARVLTPQQMERLHQLEKQSAARFNERYRMQEHRILKAEGTLLN